MHKITELYKSGRIRKSENPKKGDFLMYIDDDGKCYQIAKSKEVIEVDVTHTMKNTLLDCEYIESLHKYMVFDMLKVSRKEQFKEENGQV